MVDVRAEVDFGLGANTGLTRTLTGLFFAIITGGVVIYIRIPAPGDRFTDRNEAGI